MNKQTKQEKLLDLATKRVEEKILLERLLLERINILVSQNDMISKLYEKIHKELECFEMKKVKNDIRSLAFNVRIMRKERKKRREEK
jgi:hypothetical protein